MRISLKKQNRNKINNLIDSQLFVFHLVSSLALGRIQSASSSSFMTIDLSPEEYRSMAHPWIVAAKREKDRLWSLPYIFIETCIFRNGGCFYKAIGICKGKYAYLNIVYFDLAYIRLMHKLNWIFNPFPLPDDSPNIRQKRRKVHCIFSLFAAVFLCYISYEVSLSVLLSRNIQIPIIQVADKKHFFQKQVSLFKLPR